MIESVDERREVLEDHSMRSCCKARSQRYEPLGFSRTDIGREPDRRASGRPRRALLGGGEGDVAALQRNPQRDPNRRSR
jgi:hypothetical protein